jgi:glycosyltransferase involved in cell wall biosynthesis
MENKKVVVSIVTPCYNAEKYIGMTIESVINQTAFKNGKAILDYIIVDGGSSDKTLEIIKNIISQCVLKDQIKIISEPDNGMYDALVKGMKEARGDIFAYINADDYYNITAIDVVISIMEKYQVKWLTGWEMYYNEYGHITEMRSKYLFRKGFFVKGIYGTKLHFLQQESTFWRKELNDYINYKKLAMLRYAGDYYIWTEFSKREQLYIVETYLGGFRKRKGQLSKQIEKYNEEKKELLEGKINILDIMLIIKDRLFWQINKLHWIFNCVRNEIGTYVHFIYNDVSDEWVPLDMKFIKSRLLKTEAKDKK